MTQSIPLSEQVVLVTAPSRGLSLAIASAFQRAGAYIIFKHHHEMTPDKLRNIHSNAES